MAPPRAARKGSGGDKAGAAAADGHEESSQRPAAGAAKPTASRPQAGSGTAASTSSSSATYDRDKIIADYARRNAPPTTAIGMLVKWVQTQLLRVHMLLGTVAVDTWESVYIILLLAALLLLTLYGAYKQAHKLLEMLAKSYASMQSKAKQ